MPLEILTSVPLCALATFPFKLFFHFEVLIFWVMVSTSVQYQYSTLNNVMASQYGAQGNCSYTSVDMEPLMHAACNH